MPRVISFQESLARPESLLIDHLLNVRSSIERFFEREEVDFVKLVGLAGLCHDVAKNHSEWQSYIRDVKIQKGPNHSDCGAFFFSYLGFHLIHSMDQWEKLKVQWLWLIRDIADHHSALKSLDDKRWLKLYEWDHFDLKGIENFFHEQYQELETVSIDREHLEDWLNEAEDWLVEAEDSLDIGYSYWEPLALMIQLQKWRETTTSLISSDRFDVKTVSAQFLSSFENSFLKKIDQYSQQFFEHPLAKIRKVSQESIMEQLKQNPSQPFYTIEMPTGYGKTLAALKAASWLIEKQGFRKMIYVAPYLSILEQTSQVIENAMGIRPLEHHSLSVLNNDVQRASDSQLAMESWAHAIVCTSFQQFWKALLPARSQDVLRRSFIKDSVVIIDEPQIFSPDVWNLFLCSLEALAKLVNLKVFFLSATMPPFHLGMEKRPISLQIKGSGDYDRYELFVEREEQDENSVAELVKNLEYATQAVIVNTIEDAFRVYRHFEEYSQAYFIHGLMIPVHKKAMLNMIQNSLKKENPDPLFVISTQVLEAGVDISFQHIARALPILPSIVQSAGRVNRHLEKEQLGRITVFPFFREGEKDTRSMIYPRPLQQITDSLLLQKDRWKESELISLVNEYYKKMFQQNTYEAALSVIRDAYEGNWKKLSVFHPFQQDYLRLPIFIPWESSEFVDLIPLAVRQLMEHFQVDDPLAVYERYQDPSYMMNLSFEERKQFMILFHYYILNLPVEKALKVASQEDYLQAKVPILLDTESYDDWTGFHVPFEEFDNII